MENGKRSAHPFMFHQGTEDQWSESGLTKRELFAGMAMQGLIASCAHPEAKGSNITCYSDIPKEAVELADALLKELEK